MLEACDTLEQHTHQLHLFLVAQVLQLHMPWLVSPVQPCVWTLLGHLLSWLMAVAGDLHGSACRTTTGDWVKSSTNAFSWRKSTPKTTGATRLSTTRNSCNNFSSPSLIGALMCPMTGSRPPDAACHKLEWSLCLDLYNVLSSCEQITLH